MLVVKIVDLLKIFMMTIRRFMRRLRRLIVLRKMRRKNQLRKVITIKILRKFRRVNLKIKVICQRELTITLKVMNRKSFMNRLRTLNHQLEIKEKYLLRRILLLLRNLNLNLSLSKITKKILRMIMVKILSNKSRKYQRNQIQT